MAETLKKECGKTSIKKAIVIPFNPHLDFWGGSAIGSLVAHKMFADQHGAVYWDLVRASSHPEVNVAYFYDTDKGVVTFKAKVEFIEPKKNINPEEEKYIPNWRKMNWELKQTPGEVWIKLRDIFPLKRKHNLADFKKISDGKKLKRAQNFAIVKDPSFKEEKIRFSLDRFTDDYVYRLASQKDERLQETDIEEILWFLMLSKNLKFVQRQKGKNNRIDVAFKDYKNHFIIVEIKRGIAGLSALSQIKKYMNEIKARTGAEKIKGIILCRKADFEKRNTHRWTEEDDIVTLYLFKYGDEDLPFSIDGIVRKLGMSTGSLRMRIANFKAIDGQGGLDHFGKISEKVYKKHHRTSKDELKSLVLQILQKK